jgi:hypothetical protein
MQYNPVNTYGMLPPPSVHSLYDPRPPNVYNSDNIPYKKKEDKQKGKQFKIAVISTILFLILSHSATYRLSNQIYQAVTNRMYQLITEESIPTFKGMFIHALAFFIIVIFYSF